MKWTWVALVADACLRVLSLTAATTAVAVVLFGFLAGDAPGIVCWGCWRALRPELPFTNWDT
jgi:hypothetical protein